MTYATLMVHLEAGGRNASVLHGARHVAVMFDAAVIGIAACQPMTFDYGGGFYAGEVIEADRVEIDTELADAETCFRRALADHHRALSWRYATTTEALSGVVAHEARSADLVITGINKASFDNAKRHMNLGDLVVKAGRPVLIVPDDFGQSTFDRVMLAWTDSRESRRAVLDALPFLKRAACVEIVEIASKSELSDAQEGLADVAAWLERHGVKAGVHTYASEGDHAAQLAAIAEQLSINLIVAGAFGHGRLKEWALGGVTADLLLGGKYSTLLSH
jgi:nucleotide-binding universal stress UspA family protein